LKILDTNILIDLSRDDEKILTYLEKVEKEEICYISIITKLELLQGCRNKKELNHLKKFLLRFRLVQLDNLISERSSLLMEKYNLSHGLLILDAMIAATCIEMKAELITRNTKDFKFIEGLKSFSI
jgi:predicted nucleic acid-binding protein